MAFPNIQDETPHFDKDLNGYLLDMDADYSDSHTRLLYILKYVKHNTTARLLYLLLSRSGRVFPRYSFGFLSWCLIFTLLKYRLIKNIILNISKITATHHSHSLIFQPALAFLHSTFYQEPDVIFYVYVYTFFPL